MKKILLSLLIAVFTLNLNAQTKEQTCHFGITFEISNNPSWGYGEPVVLSVEPFSPAEKAGIKPNDIIMEVNGVATYLRDYKTIASWLFNESTTEVTFTIRNLNTYFSEYRLSRQCNEIGSLSESELATSFSFYSLEDTNERSFVLPLQVQPNPNIDYSDYHTFDFLVDNNAPAIDGEISAIIEKALNDKGLTRDRKDPDIIIQTYYSYQPNLKHNAALTPKSQLRSWRFDPRTKTMVNLPILSGTESAVQVEGQYTLELGIRFFDKKYVEPNQLTQIWDCHATEYLSEKYSLEEYARMHTPLLMMNYPYSANKTSVGYLVDYKRYNYTGFHISTDDMKTITNVDANSPAYHAGIRGGDIIKRIDDQKMDVTKDELTNAYKRFLIETMKYRNPDTRFTDANGFTDCMFWDKYKYDNIAQEFKKSIYMTYFSYLYNFQKYVTPNPPSKLMFEVETRKQRRFFGVVPEIRSSVTIEIK